MSREQLDIHASLFGRLAWIICVNLLQATLDAWCSQHLQASCILGVSYLPAKVHASMMRLNYLLSRTNIL